MRILPDGIGKGGVFSFTLSQGSLSNWASGGDNFSLAANSYLNYYLFYKNARHGWDNNVDLNLGYVNTTSSGGRKNDDRMDYLSKYGYKMDQHGKWYISGLFNFRSQFLMDIIMVPILRIFLLPFSLRDI